MSKKISFYNRVKRVDQQYEKEKGEHHSTLVALISMLQVFEETNFFEDIAECSSQKLQDMVDDLEKEFEETP